MTDLEITILETIYNQPFQEAHRENLYNLNKGNPQLIKSTIDDLLKLELIKQVPCSNNYKLTKTGLKSLHLANQERDKASKQESQQRLDNNISVANLLIPFVIFILGLLIEYHTAIFSFLISFFK